MYNRIKPDQLFVIIPIEFVDNLPAILQDFKLDANATLGFTKPPHSKFWKKKDKDKKVVAKEAEAGESPTPAFTMEWDEEARELMMKAPEGIIEFAVGNAEEFARERGYAKVTRKSIVEQMEEMGMDIDQMLGG